MLVLALYAQNTPCRADDAQVAVHTLVEPPYIFTKGAKWETDKRALSVYSPDQLVRALIAEIDLDRGSSTNNKDRNVAAYRLFRALDLPPDLLCQELDKPQTPERKASLMLVLRHANKPEVVQALLRQLGDLRSVIEPKGMPTEFMKPHPLRVCDVAYNALIDNVDVPDLQRITLFYDDPYRDRLIRKTLAQLKLAPP